MARSSGACESGAQPGCYANRNDVLCSFPEVCRPEQLAGLAGFRNISQVREQRDPEPKGDHRSANGESKQERISRKRQGVLVTDKLGWHPTANNAPTN